jgi:hypothetical protein
MRPSGRMSKDGEATSSPNLTGAVRVLGLLRLGLFRLEHVPSQVFHLFFGGGDDLLTKVSNQLHLTVIQWCR